jgi:hypothetical protein
MLAQECDKYAVDNEQCCRTSQQHCYASKSTGMFTLHSLYYQTDSRNTVSLATQRWMTDRFDF